jgi:pyrimidine-specific ribonucleoside hydrolase
MRSLSLLGAVLGFARVAAAGTIWIDTDVSIGSPIREVDDAYALVLALHSPEIRIGGISTSYGNAPLGHTTKAARELVRQFGGEGGVTPVQVFAGARSAADVGRRSEASEALAAFLENNFVTYIALGPLTNLATFLQLHPERAQKIRRVIFLGGHAEGTALAFGPGGSFHLHDANVFKDPAAAGAVVRSNIALTLVPIATASGLVLERKDLQELEQAGGAASYVSRRSKVWLWFWTNVIHAAGGPIFDAAAMVAAARPGLAATEGGYAKMDRLGDLRVTRRQSAAARVTGDRARAGRPITYCSGLKDSTKGFVMRRLMRRGGD